MSNRAGGGGAERLITTGATGLGSREAVNNRSNRAGGGGAETPKTFIQGPVVVRDTSFESRPGGIFVFVVTSAYKVFQIVQRPGVCSAGYGTVQYEEFLKSFVIKSRA